MNKISQKAKMKEMTEIEKVKSYIKENPDYKVSDVQRLLMKGYSYCYKILESIGER